MTALKDIRVLDLSRVLAGPYCTQILGDLGADIIKVERPERGDDTRNWGPPYLKDSNGNDTTESAYYLSANRNKRSIAIDIRTAEGQELIHNLLAKSDVMIENFKVGSLEKLGLGYDQIKERHPHLIYCAITGFGQNGPDAHEAGYDFVIQALSGIMAYTGEPEGQPMKIGVALSDIMTGLNAAIGILAALHHRNTTGKGQMIDLSLLDTSVAAMTNIAQYYLTSGALAPRLGNAHASIVPYNAFESSDGHIILAIGNNDQFAKFCTFIEKEEWIADERFARNNSRVNNRNILISQINKITKEKPTEHWVSNLTEMGVPCGPINTMDMVFEMDQIKAREMKIQMDHPMSATPVDLVGSPFKLSKTPVAYKNPPPFLGQHSQEILKEILDMDESTINTLKEKKII